MKFLLPKPLPRESKCPNSRFLGPKIHTLSGFWTVKPHYLGTWTLRAKPCSVQDDSAQTDFLLGNGAKKVARPRENFRATVSMSA